MNFKDQETSVITILSSHHGRLRREQRDIEKRDLQRALKYGIPTRVWGRRWKVEYDGITFITDANLRQEVTAYPSPLPIMEIGTDASNEQTKTKELIRRKPDLATSHTVIVIDNSGSMLGKKNNVHLYRDSQNAAFSMTALEFVAEQLFNNTAVNSDLVSLIKFSSNASIEFDREPISWTVYNKLLQHRNTDRYVDRLNSPHNDELYAQSNFLPALNKVDELLQDGHHEKCALSVFFFSDGKATDSTDLGLTRSEAASRISEVSAAIFSRFAETLSVTVVGLGNPNDDFSVLHSIADAATKAGASGCFQYCNKTANSIASAVSSLVSSTTETRTALLEGRQSRYTQRGDLIAERDAAVKFSWRYFKITDHFVYHPTERDFCRYGALPPAASQSDPLGAAERFESPPPFLAINRNFIGMGAERVAYRCRLSDRERPDGFVFDTMIAKETKHLERVEENVSFHRGFAETQDLANYLASEFNQALCGMASILGQSTPKLKFIACSVLVLEDQDWPYGQRRGVLVEKKLNTDKFPWVKWNDNNGMVNGKRKHIPLDVDFELKQLKREALNAGLNAIVEEEDCSDDDDSVSDDGFEASEAESTLPSHDGHIKPSDYLQAFTHFTYRFTNRKVLVCDLQGVYNTDELPPIFELTDPAIHYASSKHRRNMVFGRTDKGRSGMKQFFSTHQCSKICKFLQLSAKNKKWKRDWCGRGLGELPVHRGAWQTHPDSQICTIL